MTDSGPTVIEVNSIDRPKTGKQEGWVVHYRERARGWVTAALVFLLSVILLYPMIAIPAGWVSLEQAEGLLSLLVSPITGILGAVIGFYFGTSSGN